MIVADNGSTDGTVALVQEWLRGPLGAPVAARLTDASAYPGIPFARNCGALVSQGDIIAYCDADDAVYPEWVASIAARLKAAGAIGGYLDAVDPDGNPRPDVSHRGLGRTGYLPYAPGCNLAVTRDCFFTVGGFDESLPRYGYEDIDFSWRLQQRGFPLDFAPEVMVRFTVSNNLRSVRKEYSTARARMAMVNRHPEFDTTAYSLGYCFRDAGMAVLLLPWRMVRPRATRSREVRWLIDAMGRFAGYWHYDIRGADSTPKLLSADPLSLPGEC